jgi:hypothetical protein
MSPYDGAFVRPEFKAWPHLMVSNLAVPMAQLFAKPPAAWEEAMFLAAMTSQCRCR